MKKILYIDYHISQTQLFFFAGSVLVFGREQLPLLPEPRVSILEHDQENHARCRHLSNGFVPTY